jgi:geranylgeranyl reductase family protein
MNKREVDVVVVGGGIAGATTARLLGEAGWSVVLLDKAHFPRDKPCGEGIMPTGVQLLHQLGVLACIPAKQQHVIRGVRFVIDDISSVQGDFPDLGNEFRAGMGVTRWVLDELLLRHAQAHQNVEVHEGEAAVDVHSEAGKIDISTAKQRYRARIVVGADGLHSRVRRKLGIKLSRGRRQRYGIRTHFQLPPGVPIDDYVCVDQRADDQCFTTPVGESELQLALLIEKQKMKSLAGCLDLEFDKRIAARPQLSKLLSQAKRTSPILACGPFDIWPSCRVAARAILVGDAAGYLDPLTGEGISLALQGAFWGAEAVDDALRRNDLSRGNLLAYDRRLTQAMRNYKWLTYVLLAISRHPRMAQSAVRRLASSPTLYTKLLGINCGLLGFRDVSMREWAQFLLARPM